MTTSSRSLRSTKSGMTRKMGMKQFSNGRMTGTMMMSMMTSPCSSGKSWRATRQRTRICGLAFAFCDLVRQQTATGTMCSCDK
ncbi:hypothetical protein BRADI_2g12001v3 [Brachypodium distachyon]|uniref:Uncharacterized protein n=1 Tax=Brachypodium distachyon TaxID=15368 RepID=A0A0Q3K076_BRADI|nr:hypothetical protein BRADI_2g12001v3 [Brachypodium distachyon]